MDVQSLIDEAVQSFNQKDYVEAIEKLNQAWEEISDKSQQIPYQLEIQQRLGCCYLLQAIQSSAEKKTEELLKTAINYFKQQLELVNDLPNRLKSDETYNEEIYNKGLHATQCAIGIAYLEKFKKIKSLSSDEKSAILEKIKEVKPAVQETISELNTTHYRQILFLTAINESNFNDYFEAKKEVIYKQLNIKNPQNKNNPIDNIISILTVLNIAPIELMDIPLAHYTSPSVCKILLGQTGETEQPPAMRMNSSTYMNDPFEGSSLLDLLNLQEPDLYNKKEASPLTAFFTCFSARVNDLNQFRLYGKENGVEASGCCLVFNKNRDWLDEPDVSLSVIRDMGNNMEDLKESFNNSTKSTTQSLPLYQVAYIAYCDEYIRSSECSFELGNFAIQLHRIGEHQGWHKFRVKKLKESLKNLFNEFQNNFSQELKDNLEYIRYLFKDFAFRDEEEFRLLKIMPIDSDEVKYCSNSNAVYVEYGNIIPMIDEVILGTNYEKTSRNNKVEVMRHLLAKSHPHIKVSHSSLPINANPPIIPDSKK